MFERRPRVEIVMPVLRPRARAAARRRAVEAGPIDRRSRDTSLAARLTGPLVVARLLVAGALLGIALTTVYYYNVFVDLEQNVATAQAQIDRELQRRTDLIENLLPAVTEYAALERHVFTEVAKVRTRLAGLPAEKLTALPGGLRPGAAEQVAPAAEHLLPEVAATGGARAKGAQLGDLLGRLLAVSEQYPDMKSNEPFELLMQKIAEIEDRLAVERQRYNDCVNTYTTLTTSFPGHIFARLFGFEDRPLFTAEPRARSVPHVAWPAVER